MDSKTKIYAIFFVLVSARLGFQLIVCTATPDNWGEEGPLILIDGNAALDSIVPIIKRVKIFYDATKPQCDALAAKH